MNLDIIDVTTISLEENPVQCSTVSFNNLRSQMQAHVWKQGNNKMCCIFETSCIFCFPQNAIYFI